MRPPVFVDDELSDDNLRTMNPPRGAKRRPEPEEVAAPETRRSEPEITLQPVEPLVAPPGTGITPTPPRTAGANPLVEESRTVREAPVAAPPLVAPSARETRAPISGPSFLGLSDGPVSSDYLLDEESADDERSMGRSYLLLGFLLLFGVLVYKQWGTVTAIGREIAHNNTPDMVSESQPAKPSPVTSADTSPAPASADAKPESDAGAETSAAPAEKSAAAEKPAPPEATEEDATKKETAPPTSTETETKGSTAAAPVYDDSQVELAQKYLQGRGVAQDCNRGVSLLRSAAAQPNPKAQIKLGALYATGHCVEQDRAEAYRWFAQAHELQPGNQWIDKNLNTLWSEMTQAERARAQR